MLVAAIVAAIDLTAKTVSEVRLSHSSVELGLPTFNLADTCLIIGIIVIALCTSMPNAGHGMRYRPCSTNGCKPSEIQRNEKRRNRRKA